MRFRAPFEAQEARPVAIWYERSAARGERERARALYRSSPWGEHADVIEDWFAEGDLLAHGVYGAEDGR
jgi:hypothetical protein